MCQLSEPWTKSQEIHEQTEINPKCNRNELLTLQRSFSRAGCSRLIPVYIPVRGIKVHKQEYQPRNGTPHTGY